MVEPRRSFAPIAVAVAISVSGALPVFLVGSLSIEEGRTLGLNASHMALIVALFFVTASVGAAFFGSVADKVGGVKVMRMGAFGTCIGALVAAVSSSAFLFSIGIMFCGLIYGGSQPAVSKYLAENVHVAKQGTAFGIRQTAVPLSTVLAGIAASITSENRLWRLAFVGAALLAAFIMISLRSGTNAGSGGERTLRPDERKVTSGRSSWPLLIFLGGSLGMGAGTIYVLASFAVPGLRAVGVSPVDAGLLAAMGGILALTGRLTAGALADYLQFQPLKIAGIMLLCGSSGYFLLSTQTSTFAMMGIVIAFAIGSGWNALYLLALARDFPGNLGKASGVGLAGAYLGGVLGPLVFGFVLSHYGFSAAWLIEGIAADVAGLGGLVGWIWLRRFNRTYRV